MLLEVAAGNERVRRQLDADQAELEQPAVVVPEVGLAYVEAQIAAGLDPGVQARCRRYQGAWSRGSPRRGWPKPRRMHSPNRVRASAALNAGEAVPRKSNGRISFFMQHLRSGILVGRPRARNPLAGIPPALRNNNQFIGLPPEGKGQELYLKYRF